MRYKIFLTLFSILFFGMQPRAKAQDVTVPAGTLLRCTLNEPNLSTATTQVGDPVLCHLSSVEEFGRAAFPRGAYMAGHVEASKDPGHFFGKGNLRLVFDRIGLPGTDVSANSKLIGVHGFRTNREGDILGKGHARRDLIEWMLPPLWPWKILTLPARGPRPALKGEQMLTLRLMDDVTVPRLLASRSSWPDWRPPRPQASAEPQPSMSPQPVGATSSSYAAQSNSAPLYGRYTNLHYLPPSRPSELEASPAVTVRQPARLTLLALKSETIYPVTSYWVDGDYVSYLTPGGASGEVLMSELDWARTIQLNTERGVTITLHSLH